MRYACCERPLSCPEDAWFIQERRGARVSTTAGFSIYSHLRFPGFIFPQAILPKTYSIAPREKRARLSGRHPARNFSNVPAIAQFLKDMDISLFSGFILNIRPEESLQSANVPFLQVIL